MRFRKTLLFSFIVILGTAGGFLLCRIRIPKDSYRGSPDKEDREVLREIAVQYDENGPKGRIQALRRGHDTLAFVCEELVPRILAAQTAPDEALKKQGDVEYATLIFGNLLGRFRYGSGMSEKKGAGFDLRIQREKLGNIPGVTEKVARALGDALTKNTDIEVRRESVDALCVFSDDGLVAGPALISAIGDPDEFIRVHAALALGAIRPPGGVEALCVALKDSSARSRDNAAYSLGAYGKAALLAKSALEKARNDPDAKVRATSEAALKEIERQTNGGR